MKIYRYDVATADLCDDRKPWGTMHSSDTGEYAKYSDVERLQAEKEGLREALAATVKWMEDDSGGYEVYKAILDSAKQALSATGEGK